MVETKLLLAYSFNTPCECVCIYIYIYSACVYIHTYVHTDIGGYVHMHIQLENISHLFTYI